MKFNINSARGSFYATYFSRGTHYKKNVLEVEVEQIKPNIYKMRSLVQGSELIPYSATTTINAMTSQVDGECDCPVAFNCKHIAAALMVANDRHLFEPASKEERERLDIDTWFDRIEQHETQKIIEEKKQHQNQFFYSISAGRKAGQYYLSIKTRRLLVRGGFGKEYVYRIAKYFSRHDLPNYASDEDADIIELFTRLQDGYYVTETLELTGRMGVVLLEAALATGRCFWHEDHNNPLKLAENSSFELAWVEAGKGYLQLEYLTKEHVAKVMLLEPHFYIDVDRKEVGRAEGVIKDEELLYTLLNAPKVSRKDAKYLSKKILRKLPELSIPLPAADVVKVVENVEPQFKLQLLRDENQSLSSISLQVCYDEFTVRSTVQKERETLEDPSGEIVIIERELAKENAAREMIERFSFVNVPGTSAKKLSFVPEKRTNRSIPETWHHFLEVEIPLLEQKGWEVSFDDAFAMTFVEVDDVEANIDENNHWFDLSFSFKINGETFDTVPLVRELLRTYEDVESLPEKLYLEVEKGRFAIVDKKYVLPIIEIIFELFNSDTEGAFKLNPYDAPLLLELKNAAISFSGSKKLMEIAEKLEHFSGVARIDAPEDLQAELRDYQLEGLSWLQFIREYSFGGILADDMGLGKTMQTLAHLLVEKASGRMDKPTLIVAPTSLMSNWRREIEKCAPTLKQLVLHGSDRHEHFEKIASYDVVITTYPLIVRDFDVLKQHEFYYLILDEAQYIKNHRSKSAQHLRAIRSAHRLCLTGTPMENHLGELWGLYDFLMPGFLFEHKFFTDNIRNPIEKEQSSQKQKLLNERIKPFMLRRTKTDVATELPPKTVIIQRATLGQKQSGLYESIRVAMDKQVQDAIKEKGVARSHIMILDALLKLRQVCCDPRLVKLDRAKDVKESAKFEMLFELLLEQLEEGRKVLLFSQFTAMFTLIEARLKKEKIAYSKLTGATRKREEAIERFTSGEVPLFLISLKAGGVGLNLTQADTVIHYDPWWNPAAENQATDRAYRIGQDKPVFVYKLITEHTVEEKILELQERKQALADNVYKGKSDAVSLTQDDLSDLFQPINGEH